MFVSGLKKLHWTMHSRAKMRHYGLSEARVRRIMHSPSRIEDGIAPKTVAMMQRAGNTKHPYELWVMVEDAKLVRNVVSAWRYPGITKPRSGTALDLMRNAYAEYLEKANSEMEEVEKKKDEFRKRLAPYHKRLKRKWFSEKKSLKH